MSKEKNTEVNEIVEVEVKESTETTVGKVKSAAKKHGKTALKILGAVVLGVGAFALGAKFGGKKNQDETDYEVEEDLGYDLPDMDVDVDEEI